MAPFKKILPLVLFLFIALGILYPNPYGNNPDIVLDESYFLTSALSAIEKHTLPGWEFSVSGAYYGGVQAYIDTLAVAPAIAVVFALSGFSLTATKIWVALNTGELLHILRLVSGVLALAGLLACFFYFRRKNIPRELALTLALFLFLVLSNVFFKSGSLFLKRGFGRLQFILIDAERFNHRVKHNRKTSCFIF